MAQPYNPQAHATSVGTPNLIGAFNDHFATCDLPEILETFECSTFVEQVTTNRRMSKLVAGQLEYKYMRLSNPTVKSGKIQDNDTYDSPDSLNGEQCVIRLTDQMHSSWKIPDQFKQMRNGGADIAGEQRRKIARNMAQKYNADFLCWLGAQVHPCNEGKNAGVSSASMNLGTIASPLIINPRNVYTVFAKLEATLDEHNLPMGNRGAIFHNQIKLLLNQSLANSLANTGRGTSEYMNGMCGNANLPCGVNAYSTNCMPGVQPAQNGAGPVFPIYYLWKESIDAAWGLVRDHTGQFRDPGIKNAPYTIERTVARYGFANIYCQGIARAWVQLDPNWEDKVAGGACA